MELSLEQHYIPSLSCWKFKPNLFGQLSSCLTTRKVLKELTDEADGMAAEQCRQGSQKPSCWWACQCSLGHHFL